MGAVLLDGWQEHGQERKGDDGQVIYLAYSGDEIRNQVNGGKGVERRQDEENKLAIGEKARFSFPAAEIIDGPGQELLLGALGRNGKLAAHGAWKGDIKIISCAPGCVQSNSRMPLGVCFLSFQREWNVYGNYVRQEKRLSRISLHDI